MPRPEKVFKTEAIILRRYEFGEADRILTLLTPEHGKLRAIAKGSRKITSKMTGHVELFCRVAGLVARGGELHILSQSEQIEPYLPLREDMNRLAHAHYVVELLDRFTEFEEASQPMYALLDAALTWLCQPEADLSLITRFFELRLLRLAGFEPSLFQCVVGEEDLTARDQFFAPLEGGVVCPEHRAGLVVVPLSLTAFKMLRYMATRDYEAVRRLRVDAGLHNEMERILQGYLVHLLEVRLKSAEFIHRLKG